ncbi:MAG TPA: Asd/ArgC dimerization domain-containing protein [Terriglobales bacterium]|nr:Asd/ArgC dimerization domain-containing protein [Terriglobales bacterium]
MAVPKPKSGPPRADDMARWDALRRVAIVGAATLKGKELKDVLEERKFPAMDVRLLDDDESLGQLDAVGDEATFIQSVQPEQFEHVDFTFFASEAPFTASHWKMARDAGSVVIDMSYALEDEPGAAIRSPWVERELGRTAHANSNIVLVAHPASIVLAMLLARAQKAAALKSAVSVIFEPASEQGRRGMDELHQQTVNLLSFQELPKAVFDAQVAFNLLGRYGSESARSLESVEKRVLRHLAEITRGESSGQPARLPVPSLMLLQGPTFHSHALSVYIELENAVSAGDFAQALAGEHVRLARLSEDAPTNVAAAGQNDILVAVRRDPQRAAGWWLWAAADNLKISALTAAECAETSTAPPPKTRIQ